MKQFALLLALAFPALPANYCLIVAGLGGTPEYEKEFTKLAHELESELSRNGPDTHIVNLTGSVSTRERLREAFAKLAKDAQPGDDFSLFLIGHGSFDGDTYKFNLPGPDITAEEIASLSDSVPAKKQMIVDMSSASGAAFPILSAKGRVVITATKSGTEKNATVFARYWIEALRDPAADADKNGTVSALETFNLTQRKVKAYFESGKLLATEHATMTPQTDKTVVASLYPVLQKSSLSVALVKGPAAERAQQLEEEIERLKSNKVGMQPDTYKQQLTALLVALARVDAEGNP